jgi:hypothetical protein
MAATTPSNSHFGYSAETSFLIGLARPIWPEYSCILHTVGADWIPYEYTSNPEYHKH